MKINITTHTQNQETAEYKLARRIVERSSEYKKLIQQSQDKRLEHERLIEQRDIKQMINIIAILLDKTLSFEERLRRAGRAPASSSIVKHFKNKLEKRLKKNMKFFIKLRDERNKGLKNGILGITLADFAFGLFLRKNISSTVNIILKVNNRIDVKKRALDQRKTNTLKFYIHKHMSKVKNRNSNEFFNKLSNLKDSPVIHSVPKLSGKLNPLGLLKTGKTIQNSEMLLSSRISHQEALRRQREMESLNSRSTLHGRVMSLGSSPENNYNQN